MTTIEKDSRIEKLRQVIKKEKENKSNDDIMYDLFFELQQEFFR